MEMIELYRKVLSLLSSRRAWIQMTDTVLVNKCECKMSNVSLLRYMRNETDRWLHSNYCRWVTSTSTSLEELECRWSTCVNEFRWSTNICKDWNADDLQELEELEYRRWTLSERAWTQDEYGESVNVFVKWDWMVDGSILTTADDRHYGRSWSSCPKKFR